MCIWQIPIDRGLIADIIRIKPYFRAQHVSAALLPALGLWQLCTPFLLLLCT